MATTTTTTTDIDDSVQPFAILIQESLKKRETAEEISDRLAAAFESSEVTDATITSVRDLSKKVKDIKEMFTKIGQSFVEFDNANFLDDKNNVIQLGSQWHEFQTRSMHSLYPPICVEYTGIILTDVESDARQALREELQGFVAQLKQKADDASRAKGEFGRLAIDLRNFTAVLEGIFKKANVRLATDLQATRTKLEGLRVQLKEVTDKIQSMSEACVEAFAVGGSSAGGFFARLSPRAIWTALKEVFTHEQETLRNEIDKAKQKENSLKTEINVLEAQLADLLAKEELLARYMCTLEATKGDINSLADKVDAISNIWQCLRADMIKLDTALSNTVDPNMPLTYFFMKKIRATRALYMNIAYALEMYAKGTEAP
ncbi:hypothetical protein BN946_scf184851.g69 [Trametes cinnabarina]|uniref:Uncharacterized protein n=1 Tax=Pycnoporus cinnabarinus TaxID=5643 RepID=A0A060S637_PYCCI|nr:hypothetical protein BN946_scf184851.g69 [Trametes cinnabarina]